MTHHEVAAASGRTLPKCVRMPTPLARCLPTDRGPPTLRWRVAGPLAHDNAAVVGVAAVGRPGTARPMSSRPMSSRPGLARAGAHGCQGRVIVADDRRGAGSTLPGSRRWSACPPSAGWASRSCSSSGAIAAGIGPWG